MSYCLIAYDKQAAPKPRAELMAWLQKQLAPNDSLNPHDPATTSLGLRNWLRSMVDQFPALNGPGAAPDVDFNYMTDYFMGSRHIYAHFPTATGPLAAEIATAQARRWGVGLYDPADERVIRT